MRRNDPVRLFQLPYRIAAGLDERDQSWMRIGVIGNGMPPSFQAAKKV